MGEDRVNRTSTDDDINKENQSSLFKALDTLEDEYYDKVPTYGEQAFYSDVIKWAEKTHKLHVIQQQIKQK